MSKSGDEHSGPDGVRPAAEQEDLSGLEHAPCPLGCSARDASVLVSRDRQHGLGGTFPVVRCACGLLRTQPRPTRAAIGRYYPRAYAPYGAPRAEHGLLPAAQARTGTAQARRFGRHELIPSAAPGRALEVGCAGGHFMRELRARGWDVWGIETSPEAAERARAQGFEVECAPLEDARGFDLQFDLIVASHSLEHLHEPLLGLQRLHTWARPGAWLSVAVPDASSLLFRQFGAAWYDLDVPRHLFHFTPATLRALLIRAGWQPQRLRGQATVNSLAGTLGNWLVDRDRRRLGSALQALPRSSGRARSLLRPLGSLLAALGQSGRMVAWSRKPERA